jgi:ankyrin repeat protein
MHISDVEVLRELVKLGASLEQTDQHGNTVLIRELFVYHVDRVTDKIRFLCEETDQINVANSMGITPLHTAAARSGVQALEYLIEQGADLSALTADGLSVLEVAMVSYSGQVGESRFISEVPQSPHKEWIKMRLEVVEFLLGLEAPLGEPDESGWTVLHRPLEPNMLRALVQHGAEINARTADEGNTPLIAAAKRRDAHAVEALLDSGALPGIKNNAGKTAIELMTPPASLEWKQRRQGLNRRQKLQYPQDTEFYRRVYERLDSMSGESASRS